MRRLAIAAATATALFAAQGHADPYNWTGYYAGLNVGGSWDSGNISQLNSSASLPPFAFVDNGTVTGIPGTLVFVPGTFPLPGTIRATSSNGGSILGGGQLGVDWQLGSEVFGVGADIDGLDSSQRFAFTGPSLPFSFASTMINGSINLRRNVEGTVRMRLGHAWDRWLLYGTAGIAFSSLDVSSTYNYNLTLAPGLTPIPGVSNPANTVTSSSSSRFLMGPSIGAGLEYAVCDNVSVGVDYRHNFFGNKRLNLGMTPTLSSLGGPGVPPFITVGSPVSARYNLDEDAVMLRVNWRFSR